VTPLPDVRVGDIRVRELTWLADPQDPAAASAAALAADIDAWLGDLGGRGAASLHLVA